MITVHCDNINPDDYIYKTNLKFGDDVGKQILDQVNADKTYFDRRYNYNAQWDYVKGKELVKTIGREKARELLRRYLQIKPSFPGENVISFKQYFCGDKFNNLIMEATPNFLKQVAPEEPYPILQISDIEDGVGVLPPHCGHQRISSLFCLLQGGGQETRWYRERVPFETISPVHLPDIDKLELAVSAVLEPGIWYVFNHRTWHSVHKFSNTGPDRVSFGIDFKSITAPDLVKLVKSNGG